MELNDLQAAVAAEDTVIDSAIVFIQGIPALIASAGTDAGKLAALQNDIIGKTASLAAAIAGVNTQTPAPTTPTPASAPAPAPVPEPAPAPAPEVPPPAPTPAPETPPATPPVT